MKEYERAGKSLVTGLNPLRNSLWIARVVGIPGDMIMQPGVSWNYLLFPVYTGKLRISLTGKDCMAVDANIVISQHCLSVPRGEEVDQYWINGTTNKENIKGCRWRQPIRTAAHDLYLHVF